MFFKSAQAVPAKDFLLALQVSHLFSEWCRLCDVASTNETAYSHYISQLHQLGLLKGDDITDRFFRISMVNLFFFIFSTC